MTFTITRLPSRMDIGEIDIDYEVGPRARAIRIVDLMAEWENIDTQYAPPADECLELANYLEEESNNDNRTSNQTNSRNGHHQSRERIQHHR